MKKIINSTAKRERILENVVITVTSLLCILIIVLAILGQVKDHEIKILREELHDSMELSFQRGDLLRRRDSIIAEMDLEDSRKSGIIHAYSRGTYDNIEYDIYWEKMLKELKRDE